MERGAERTGERTPGKSGSTPDRVMSLYWEPVYRFIRKAGPYPAEEAWDLTQDFLSRLFEARGRGRLPSSPGEAGEFLKEALRGFLSELRRRRPGLEAKGGRLTLSLEGADPEIEIVVANPEHLAPDEVTDRHWAEELLSRTA